MKQLRAASLSVLLLVLSQLRAAAIGGPDVTILTAPLSQSVAAGDTVIFSVIATVPGVASFQWRHGDKLIVHATNGTFILTNAQLADAGQYVVSIIGAGRRVDAPAAVLTVDGISVQDLSGPRLAISSPVGNFVRTTDGVLMVIGTATDDAGVAGICYQQNGGAWAVLPPATNWMFNATLNPGTNTFYFKASDVVGNYSPTQKVVVYYSVTQPLSLTVVGSGLVQGATNGQVMEIGAYCSLKATPSLGSYFSSWNVDGVVSTNLTVGFYMTSNTTVVATFVGNPFIPIDGVYHGLFYDTNDPAHETSGFLTFKLTEQGRFSGRLLSGGESLPFSGQFGMDLRVRQTAVRKLPKSPITVELQLEANSDRITGKVVDGTQTSRVEGYRQMFSSSLNPATNFAGKYTMAFSGGADSATSPAGHGHGAVTVSTAGAVQFKGTLADGVAASHKASLASNGQWPLYLVLYKGQGSIFGWLTLADVNGNDVSGQLLWTKPSGFAGAYYPGGFVNDVTVKGSKYVVPLAGSRAVDITNGLVVLEDGNLSQSTTNEVALDNLNRITVAPGDTNRLALKLTASSGLVSGSFVHPQTLKKSVIKGVVLQRQSVGAGFFLGTNQSGVFHLGLPDGLPLFE